MHDFFFATEEKLVLYNKTRHVYGVKTYKAF